jgi:O-antigen/teichoic acid export membrane protein
MRQRVILGTKLFETVARGVFVLTCTYRLPLVDAGQFGLGVTLIGLAAFLLAYERQIDLQRAVAGHEPAVIRQRLSDTLRFFAAHFAWLLPLLAWALWQGFGWSPVQVALAVIIIVSEHASNQSYQATLVSPRNYPLQAVAAVRQGVLAAGALLLTAIDPDSFTVDRILWWWASVSLLALPVAGWVWAVVLRLPAGATTQQRQTIRQQYRASRLHFMVGVVAVAALQADRVVVGAALAPADIGTYFRNVMLAGLALQVFSIVSFGRVAPTVYAMARAQNMDGVRQRVRREYVWFATVTLVLLGLALTVNVLAGYPASRLGVSGIFLSVLMFGVLLRAAADYTGLLLLASGADRAVFQNQLMAVLVGVSLLMLLAYRFGLPGAIAGAVPTSLAYLALNSLALRKRAH